VQPVQERNLMNQFSRWLSMISDLSDSLDCVAPLLMRIYFGYFWAETGKGKIHNLDCLCAKIRRLGLATFPSRIACEFHCVKRLWRW
jgi:hypothetical protein